MNFMTRKEVGAFFPDPLPVCEEGPTDAPLIRARRNMQQTGCWSENQQMGARWPIGCVALEITQRCNLDCTLCYLSENSEAVRDLPIDEVFRRIDLIYRHYGKGIDVQITGGDPTLRKREELLAIVRRVFSLGMRPTLMTNGKKVTRILLKDLVDAGLFDVAFHVDTTQNIKGYTSEVGLNRLRQKYIEMARGLPLSVFFNTTIHKDNYHEIPELIRFFRSNADVVRTAAFQLQADTGRGVAEKRDVSITLDTVWAQIELGAGTKINFSSSLIGHPQCSRYGLCLEANGNLYDLLDDTRFIGRIQSATAHLTLDRMNPVKTAWTFFKWFLRNPGYVPVGMRWFVIKAWRIKRDLIASGGRVRTISFLTHHFMDSCALQRDRIDACVFKTMTGDGPLSMCLLNAKRDDYILQPVAVKVGEVKGYWQPLTNEVTVIASTLKKFRPEMHALKHLKGRTRKTMLEKRRERAI